MISRMKVFRSRFAVDSATLGPIRYLLPLALAVGALLPRLLLYPYLDERSAFVLFTLAVMTSAWYGGWRLGLLATVISDSLGAYFVLRPSEHARKKELLGRVHSQIVRRYRS